jgi:hypothetical protein
MRPEDIKQRLEDIHVEIHSLDSLKDGYDDVNIHIIDDRINELHEEKTNLQFLLKNCFNQLIGL